MPPPIVDSSSKVKHWESNYSPQVEFCRFNYSFPEPSKMRGSYWIKMPGDASIRQGG